MKNAVPVPKDGPLSSSSCSHSSWDPLAVDLVEAEVEVVEPEEDSLDGEPSPSACPPASKRIRNRRLAALHRTLIPGGYYTVEAMKSRQPRLYHEWFSSPSPSPSPQGVVDQGMDQQGMDQEQDQYRDEDQAPTFHHHPHHQSVRGPVSILRNGGGVGFGDMMAVNSPASSVGSLSPSVCGIATVAATTTTTTTTTAAAAADTTTTATTGDASVMAVTMLMEEEYREGGGDGDEEENHLHPVMTSRRRRTTRRTTSTTASTTATAEGETLVLLMEFTRVMQELFLDGLDVAFDYAAIDADPRYDDPRLEERDRQDRYFDQDDDDDLDVDDQGEDQHDNQDRDNSQPTRQAAPPRSTTTDTGVLDY